MTIGFNESVAIIAVTGAVTIAVRALPFILFGRHKEMPKSIDYLGKILPPAIIATLVVYCLKGIDFRSAGSFVPELVSAALVAILHVWKRNVLLSMAGGTVLYMFLVQVVFA